MSTWILLMFLVNPQQSSNGAATIGTVNVPGFTSRAQCLNAANAAMTQALVIIREVRAVCIEQPKAVQHE